MRRRLQVVSVLMMLSACWGASFVGALPGPQSNASDPAPEAGAAAEGSAESEPEELMTDADRVIRIEGIIELDQQKLDQLKGELIDFETLFEEIADDIRAADASLAAIDSETEALTDDPNAQKLAELETSRTRVEALTDTLRGFSDLLFTAESSTRQQIQELEKKLIREHRSLDEIRGLAPAEPAARVTAEAPSADPAAEQPSSISLPGMPGVKLPTGSVVSKERRDRVQTADQLRALRELERAEREVVLAERAVEEFVKRRESLETQIQLEETLLQTASDSATFLRDGLQLIKQEIEAGDLSDVVSDAVRIRPGAVRRINEMIEKNDADVQKRSDYLESLGRRLAALSREELRVVAEVDGARDDARTAHQHLLWLESPLHPQNLMTWVTQRGPRVLLVIVAAALLLFLVRVAARRTARVVMGTGRGTRAGRENRADTIGLSIQSVATLVIIVGGTLLVFQEAGVDIKTVLGGAAILGVAFAFGAQNMMRDYFSGFMILLEDQYGLGDLVTISGVTGRVETVNMRTTVLRDIEGRVHFIPNGDVKLVTNRTYEWGRAVLEIPVSYRQNVDRAMEVLIDVCREMRRDEEWGEYLTDEPGMLGVDKFTEYGVIIKFMQETRPDKIFPVRRELLRRVKNRFDAEGIEIPVPQRTVYLPDRERED